MGLFIYSLKKTLRHRKTEVVLLWRLHSRLRCEEEICDFRRRVQVLDLGVSENRRI